MIDEKEVLKILKRYEGRMNPTAYFGLEADIVNIEEYAEPTKNDLGVDCIGRQAVMDCFKKWQPYMATRLWDFEQELSNLPSVTPQVPRKGQWIEHFDESGKWYECDQCHTDWGGAVNFCPDCGADMRGDVKE